MAGMSSKKYYPVVNILSLTNKFGKVHVPEDAHNDHALSVPGVNPLCGT